MTLTQFRSPQLLHVHSGKVRESFRIDASTRLIVTTDRVSAFDRVLDTPIPDKGVVLNELSAFWFGKTADIVENHFITSVDSQAMLVREVLPIRVELIVRGYLTGSMWRQYAQGVRRFSGVSVPDGLARNARFAEPLLTPTTKEESDREITPQEIVASGLVSGDLSSQMETAALKLFASGTEFLRDRGVLLVDTKYEFGVLEGRLILIDEIHTPDSSRFWRADSYEADPAHPFNLDKEYIRAFLLEQKAAAGVTTSLPAEVVDEARARYGRIYELTVGSPPPRSAVPPEHRLYHNLVAHGIIRDGFVAVVMGSPKDADHARRLASVLEGYGVSVDLRVVSAHKNPEDVAKVLAHYADSAEPGAIIAVAGMSNGLGGALAGSTTLPVINCPPFKDGVDLQTNVNSSLMMPSGVPAATVISPQNAAMAALRSLNLPRLKHVFQEEIAATKATLRESDNSIRHDRKASA
ncbi:AIR carboxylase family protein [Candidatus Fermentibacteria bacterium]|nr:AIR carboxylase family protein [Candidatus Fermentibacteria bacterium]